MRVNKTICTIFCVLSVETRLSRYILRPSSDVSCLSGHRNDSTREIISKVGLLIKKSVQEIFLVTDKQETPEKGRRIQRPKCCVSTNDN